MMKDEYDRSDYGVEGEIKSTKNNKEKKKSIEDISTQ